jgi:hypothetical protein
VAACAKHFVGDGGTQNGINENNTIIDREGLMSIHMPAYLDALRKGVSTVMISYSSWNGLKMHANHDLITRFLKGRLNFQVSEKNRCALQSLDALTRWNLGAQTLPLRVCFTGLHDLGLGGHRQDHQSSRGELLLLCAGFNSCWH